MRHLPQIPPKLPIYSTYHTTCSMSRYSVPDGLLLDFLLSQYSYPLSHIGHTNSTPNFFNPLKRMFAFSFKNQKCGHWWVAESWKSSFRRSQLKNMLFFKVLDLRWFVILFQHCSISTAQWKWGKNWLLNNSISVSLCQSRCHHQLRAGQLRILSYHRLVICYLISWAIIDHYLMI